MQVDGSFSILIHLSAHLLGALCAAPTLPDAVGRCAPSYRANPRLRQFDPNYGTYFYINTTVQPAQITWTHPGSKDGEAHPEQVQAVQKVAEAASQLPQEEQERIAQQQTEFLQQQAEAAKQGKAAETGKHSAAMEANDRGLGSLLGHALAGSSGKQSSGMSSMGGLGAAAGGGGVGALLGSLLGSAASSGRYSSSYSHSMGPPPFMMGSGLGGMGMGGMGMGMGGLGGLGGMGMMGGRPMGMGGMGMGPFGMMGGGMGMGMGGSPFGE